MKKKKGNNEATRAIEEQSGSGPGIVMEVVPGGTSEIPSGSPAYHRKDDTPRLQECPWSQTVEGSKKRRNIGKQKPALYQQPNVSMKRKADEQGEGEVKRISRSSSDPHGKDRNQDDDYMQLGGRGYQDSRSQKAYYRNEHLYQDGTVDTWSSIGAIINVQGCPFSPCRVVDRLPENTIVDLIDNVTSNFDGQTVDEQVGQTGTSSSQSREDDNLTVTSQGPGVQKCGPSFPLMNEEHDSKRLRTSEAGVNRQQECERFYIGDEDAIPTRYRVCGKSKSERLLKRKR